MASTIANIQDQSRTAEWGGARLGHGGARTQILQLSLCMDSMNKPALL